MPDPMDSRALDVLMLVATLAPIAVYFLVLGLVNSHARPFLITGRTDFILLTSVLIPCLAWPIPAFAVSGTWWPLLVGFVMAMSVFLWMLPSAGAGFVIYNLPEARGRRLIAETVRSLGWCGRWVNDSWRSDDGRRCLHVSAFGPLRNVSIHFEPGTESCEALEPALRGRLESMAQLPSNMGVCLVVIAVALLIAPMWAFGRHIHDLVDAMSRLFG